MLDRLRGPGDLKEMTAEQLEALARELRSRIVETTLRNGGHLASNLGAVELTIALHRCFDSPRDAIVFDVGHQCYAHKLLTGRCEQFATLRLRDGLSGFPKRRESEHDYFDTGHSGTALSLALGLCRSFADTGRRAVAVVGDGAATGGVFLEALNDAGHHGDPVIVVLNDNEMSISPNVGAMSRYLAKMRMSRRYRRFKVRVVGAIDRGRIGRSFKAWLEKLKNAIKYFVLPTSLFEDMGFIYLGPVDGHDRETLETVLNLAKTVKKRPVLVHVVTKKGKGYPPAERDPVRFHGVSPASGGGGPSLSLAFGRALVEAGARRGEVCAITAAMREGTGLSAFAQRFPQRFHDVGIAEQHAVALAAGLAAGGPRPVVAVYGSFLQRAYDQVLMDVCLNALPVTLAVDRGGLVGQDGETHQGIFDLGYLRQMPGLEVLAPAGEQDMAPMLTYALEQPGPVALHYAKEGVCVPYDLAPPLKRGRVLVLKRGGCGAVLAVGAALEAAHQAVNLLAQQGVELTLAQARFVAPLDEDWLIAIEGPLWTVEENQVAGGFGSAVLEWCARHRPGLRVYPIGIEKPLVAQGTIAEQRAALGLDGPGIARRIGEDLECKPKVD